MALSVQVVAGRNLIPKNSSGKSDCYAQVILLDDAGNKVGKTQQTKVQKGTLNPRWGESLPFDVAGAGGLKVMLWDKHRFRSDKFMGQTTLRINRDRLAQEKIDAWFALKRRATKEPVSGEVHLIISSGAASAGGGGGGGAAAAAGGGGGTSSSGPGSGLQSATDLAVSAAYAAPSTGDALKGSTHVVVDDDDGDDKLDADDFVHVGGAGGGAAAEEVDDGVPYDGPGGAIDDYERVRVGPAAATMERLKPKEDKDVSISSKGMEVTNSSGAAGGEAWARATVHVVASAPARWQFQAQIVSPGQMLIGWASTDWDPRAHVGKAWCFDGSRQVKCQDGASQTERYGEYWSAGDVITCVLDTKAHTIEFWRNTTSMGRAFNDVAPPSGADMVPVIHCARRAKALFNFGKERFTVTPVPAALRLHSTLTDKHLAQLAGIYHQFQDYSNRALIAEAIEEAGGDVAAEAKAAADAHPVTAPSGSSGKKAAKAAAAAAAAASEAGEDDQLAGLSADALEMLASKHHADLKDSVHGAGILKLQQDLTGKLDDSDPTIMLAAFHLRCETQWEISKAEWMNGWQLLGCHTMVQMRTAARGWMAALKDDAAFRPFYDFVFDYLKDDPAKKVLLLDEATVAWDIVLEGTGRPWPLLPLFLEFLNEEDKKAIPKDAWQQLFHFMRDHAMTVDNYDDDAWPSLFDEFYEYAQDHKDKQPGHAKPAGSGGKDDDSSSSSSSSSSDSD